MSTSSNGSSSRIDIYSIITNQVIEFIEQHKTVPWVKPWADAGIPMNLISKRPYRGINIWLLSMLNFEKNLFMTFDQIKAHGGSVKKGEHGQMIVYYKKKDDANEESPDSSEKKKNKSLLLYYKVFNISQITGIESLLPVQPQTVKEFDPMLECEAIFHKMPSCPELVFKQQKAFYDVEKDYINMPKKKSFKSVESFYSVLFHEAIHSTGHESRLNRPTITDMEEFGSSSYSLEELIAELGSCYLCHFAGILPKAIQNSAAYIEGWLKQLKDDKRFIITASAQGQKAVDYILGFEKPGSEKIDVLSATKNI